MKSNNKSLNKIDVFSIPIKKGLFMLAWPIILSNLLETIYNITDAFFLGKLGPVEFSAPTVSFPIIFVFISLAAGFSHAGSAMVAQYTGMGEKENSEKAAAQTILTVIIASTIIMILGLVFSGIFLRAMNVPENVYDYALGYIRLIFMSIPWLFLNATIAGAFRGWGNSLIALKFNFVAVTINILLDPLFIFYFGLGVNGAAIATFIARGSISILFLIVLISGKLGFRVHAKDFIPDLRYINKVIKIGLPSSFGQATTAFGFTIITGVVAGFGAEVIAGYGVGNRIVSMIVMFAIGISLATAAMVGQFIGAERQDLAKETIKVSSGFTFSIVFIVSTLLFFFGQYVTRFFINDPEVIQIGKTFFSLVSFSLPFFATMKVFQETLRGTGHTIQSTIVDIIRLWGVRIPLVIWFSNMWGFEGIFYAMLISNISALGVALLFFKKGDWKYKVVEKYT